MTLIEVLVAMGIFGVLGSLLLSFGIETSHITDETSNSVDLNEEARVAFERLARDLRDADHVTQVLPDSSGSCGADEFAGVSFTEGTTEAADVPHAVSYKWDTVNKRLILSEAIPDPEQQPILAAKVSRLCIQLWSSRWSPIPVQPDKGTSWAELNPPSPPNLTDWWCTAQLADVDRVSLSMTAEMHGHARTYTTDVFLRNARIGEEAADGSYCP
ncbi:prepilin-type N-terminal cleavage/methylation domain-containing protein [Nocardioides panaciterrulae]|uniref:Prepilin-type N-terminal cleavage/methylation domain-containing protein n=2 Tax=Nocardioides panaciterrulae TaxID=661492 RepID=A0A7Y9E7X7_9ACTN|nr:type II secretion system protein [Nocardioides panaciterrulae]NYD42874.1 prepilin-type N-terminal cleavage/methylation domain-containing protein [Nocardioides panaciterrulae]